MSPTPGFDPRIVQRNESLYRLSYPSPQSRCIFLLQTPPRRRIVSLTVVILRPAMLCRNSPAGTRSSSGPRSAPGSTKTQSRGTSPATYHGSERLRDAGTLAAAQLVLSRSRTTGDTAPPQNTQQNKVGTNQFIPVSCTSRSCSFIFRHNNITADH